ncbi:hypothetical protein [Providencia phage PSTCR7]|uniref:Uncharacterized protein n=1 Tax=Providencia phage PSTCR7 TaxID=2783549 RepID=A0A7S9XGP2_9CAUD|nr:hypothetical protein PQD10_gp44 [Providencia phage PSTCR7]QPI18496.1 hypothetical protein [Providencia phage PSTCR7]
MVKLVLFGAWASVQYLHLLDVRESHYNKCKLGNTTYASHDIA